MLTVNRQMNPLFPAQIVEVREVLSEYGGNLPCVFWIEDCMDPPVFIAMGDSLEDAEENFLLSDFAKEATVIKDFEMKDYDPENVQYNEDGDPIDKEAVRGYETTWADIIKMGAES